MQRYEVIVLRSGPQTVQQTFIDIAAPRNNRKEMGFASHQQMVILKEYRFGKRDQPFLLHFPEIEQLPVWEIFCIRSYRGMLCVEYLACADALLPATAPDAGETSGQELQDRRVGPLCSRQGDGRGGCTNCHHLVPVALACRRSC